MTTTTDARKLREERRYNEHLQRAFDGAQCRDAYLAAYEEDSDNIRVTPPQPAPISNLRDLALAVQEEKGCGPDAADDRCSVCTLVTAVLGPGTTLAESIERAARILDRLTALDHRDPHPASRADASRLAAAGLLVPGSQVVGP